ncbi:hypothetical protein V2J09_019674 [Rumex salicifolius]
MKEERRSFDSFLRWAAELGVSDALLNSATLSNHSCLGQALSLACFPDAGGRGLAATRDLRRGELILRVPKGALMTRDSILEKDEKLSDAIKRHSSLSSTQMLAVLLLAEMNKGKRSLWYPYLIHLPRSYDILPTFGPFELKALQVEDATWATEKAISKAESDWKQAIALMEQLNLKPQFVTFKAWLWASATISSRTLHVPWDDAGCLCPVGDLFNYAPPGEDFAEKDSYGSSRYASSKDNAFINGDGCEDITINGDQCDECSERLTDGGYEEDIAAYCFYAKKNYCKGQQVLLSYGTYTNVELLEHYGFILSNNPNDKVFIPLPHEIIGTCSWPADSLCIQYNGRPSFSLLSSLRLWATPPNQRRSVGHLAFSGSQLSPENEIIVMKWIATNCHTVLQNLATSVEDDLRLLASIDGFQGSFLEPRDLPCTDENEFSSFLSLHNGEIGENNSRVQRSLDKWKLSVNWRLGYKKILVDCISFCTRTIQDLSPIGSTNLVNHSGNR